MWNPPWVLPLAAPLGLMDVHAAHLIWMLLHLAVLLWCADRLWLYYGGPEQQRLTAAVLACTFLPTWCALIVGQISPLLLLGAVGFLLLLRRGNDLAAGAVCVLLAVKPHLVYLFWLALLLWSVQQRRWRVLLGGALTGVALTLAACAMDPGVLGQYWHTLTHQPPAQYRSPTLGTLLRLAVGDGSFRWQFLALAPGLAWFAWHWRRQRKAWDWAQQMPILLLVSVLTTAYGGWVFDLVVLLVPIIAAATALVQHGSSSCRGAALAGFIVLNALALVLLLQQVEYLGFIWMTPALLLVYAGVVVALRQGEVACGSAGPATDSL